MRPLLQHASRSIFADAAALASRQSSGASIPSLTTAVSNTPSRCLRCQFRAWPMSFPRNTAANSCSAAPATRRARRHFSTSKILLEKEKEKEKDNEPPSTRPDTPRSTEDTIARVPAEDLPSHREGQRWDFSKRLSELMDELLPKLAIVTHKVNTFTGTDYSGIEALRREIKEQEKLVKVRRLAIDEAKQALEAAHTQQASSQKEVVALLERKHSWLATDLERYMSLIRSEHVNDQAIREAKDAIQAAEFALEEARTQLEKRERAQYHEEQIWSDTIRRNSTWVTFGLMGFNILLLLTSLIAIEPWRRSRMVKEIKMALDAQKTAIESGPGAQLASTIEANIDAVVEPASHIHDHIDPIESATSLSPVEEAVEAAEETVEAVEAIEAVEATDAIEATVQAQDVATDATADPASPGAALLTPEQVEPQEAINIEDEVYTSTVPATWQDKIAASARDLFSERTILVRKKDVTTAVVQAAAAGAVISGALITLLRQK